MKQYVPLFEQYIEQESIEEGWKSWVAGALLGISLLGGSMTSKAATTDLPKDKIQQTDEQTKSDVRLLSADEVVKAVNTAESKGGKTFDGSIENWIKMMDRYENFTYTYGVGQTQTAADLTAMENAQNTDGAELTRTYKQIHNIDGNVVVVVFFAVN
jgi:sugar diacid utilization regulator